MLFAFTFETTSLQTENHLEKSLNFVEILKFCISLISVIRQYQVLHMGTLCNCLSKHHIKRYSTGTFLVCISDSLLKVPN